MIDGIGFAAAGLVFATFCMRSMGALRWAALASNLAFIAYGYLGDLMPVLLLHVLLLPVNACRLMQLCRAGGRRYEPVGEPGKHARTQQHRHRLFQLSQAVAAGSTSQAVRVDAVDRLWAGQAGAPLPAIAGSLKPRQGVQP